MMGQSSLNLTLPGFQRTRAEAIKDLHAVVTTGLQHRMAVDFLHLLDGKIAACPQPAAKTINQHL